MDAEERRIQRILKAIDPEDDWAAMERWGRHLRKVLKFPFHAKVAEPQEEGPLRTGDKVVVTRTADVDDQTREAIEDWQYWVAQGYQF